MPQLKLDLYSEPYAPTGNIGDSGFRKLLGTPTLDVMQTVVREAIQNCCDAAKLGRGPEIKLRLRRLDDAQRVVMQRRVFSELPASDVSRKVIMDFLNRKSPVVLEICDFGTTGLGGPTRADRLPADTTETDFIDFLRNVGTSRDTHQGGGTYGFGKVSLYMASRASTILVDTLCSSQGSRERRLMACHLGPASSIAEGDKLIRRYTGRHWWGRLEGSNDTAFAEPLLADDAVQLAADLGMPTRSGTQSGTTIMILDPYLDSETLLDAGERLVQSLLWNFWPRMMRDVPPERKIRIGIEIDGKVISVPDPESYPPLDLFSRAMRNARSANSESDRIMCQRPQKELGRIAIQKGAKGRRIAAGGDDAIIPNVAHHIAVMRPVELVVRYFEGDPLPEESIEWAGVFLVSSEEVVERAFAEAEPPAHDDWQPGIMEKGKARTFVNVAIREIRKVAKAVAMPPVERVEGASSGKSLASVAQILGSALSTYESKRARGRKDGKRRSSSNAAWIGPVEPLDLVADNRGRMARFRAEIDGADQETTLVASAGLALDGGSSMNDDLDQDRIPEIVSISTSNGPLTFNGQSWKVGEYSGELIISVLVPGQCAVVLSLAAQKN